MKFVKQLSNRMKWPKIVHIYQYFLKTYFARKCIVLFWKNLLNWQEFYTAVDRAGCKKIQLCIQKQ